MSGQNTHRVSSRILFYLEGEPEIVLAQPQRMGEHTAKVCSWKCVQSHFT